MRSAWLALAAFGCRSILGIEDPPDTSDAKLDSAPPTCASWRPQLFDPCSLGLPQPALQLLPGMYRYDTKDEGGVPIGIPGMLAQGVVATIAGAPVAVLSVEALTIERNATLTVVGPKPLLVVSWGSIRIDGAIDAGSHLVLINAANHISETMTLGAGADQGCTGAGMDGEVGKMNGGSGGGGGGGAQGPGGTGAIGGGGSMIAGAGDGGGRVALAFRGGCRGGTSGPAGPAATDPANSNSRALGGGGGGAIRLVAHDQITVGGSVSANGAGGAGAPRKSGCGGGGGGAGGYVALEAQTVTITATGTLAANGGGGGGGGATTDNFGNDGSDGRVDTEPAAGGLAPTIGFGGPGGAGAAGMQLAGSTGGFDASSSGGGGGGGGAGYVVVVTPSFSPLPGSKISPSRTPP